MFTFRKKDAKLLAKKSDLIDNETLKNAVLSNAQNELGGQGFLQFLQFGQFGQFTRSITILEVDQIM